MSTVTNLQPWQEKLLVDIESGGIKPGEMYVMMAGRHVGKSVARAAYKRLFDAITNRPVEDLILSEGKVYGSRYYCVEPVGGNWMDMEVWCLDTYGNPGTNMWGDNKAPEPAQRWYMNNRKFWFREQKDRDWFILKWRS